MVLGDTGAETPGIYSDPTEFSGDRVMIGGFEGRTIPVTQAWLQVGVGHLLPREYEVSVASVPEYILGKDILWAWALALHTTVGEFRL